MKEPDLPGQEHVPDRVLDELQNAFSDPTPSYDFDDPAIDRMLGLQEADDTGEFADDTRDITSEVAVTPGPPRRTIVIADDELPDLVYLDEEKEKGFHERREAAAASSSERSTIVIDDLDDYVTIEPPPSRTSGGIDPRIRARRNAVSKEQNRRRLLVLGIAGGIVVVLILVVAIFASTLFDVRKVYVQGAVYTDKDVLDSVVKDLTGKAVLLVDTHAAEVKLEGVPWVEAATVKTDFPHSVYIDIRERRPIATFQGADQQFRVIDAEGRVLDVIAGQPIDYMLITGQNPNVPRGGFAPAPYAAAAQLVVSLPAQIKALTSSVGVDAGTGSLTMSLNGTITVRLGDSRNLDEKLARLLGQVRTGLDGTCELDVSTDEVGVVPCST